jgi:hypothetical protein
VIAASPVARALQSSLYGLSISPIVVGFANSGLSSFQGAGPMYIAKDVTW